MDWDKKGYDGGSGFIFPEFTTIELQQNFDNIIKKLKEQGILPVS